MLDLDSMLIIKLSVWWWPTRKQSLLWPQHTLKIVQ